MKVYLIQLKGRRLWEGGGRVWCKGWLRSSMFFGDRKKETGLTPILPVSHCGVPKVYTVAGFRYVRSGQVGMCKS